MLASRRLVRTLKKEHVDYQVLPHEHTESARAEARALHLSPDEVAKTVVIVNTHGFIRAVVPAWALVDLEKVRKVLGIDHKLRLASEEELAAAYPSFELGAVPPIGGPAGDRVIVDRILADHETIVFEAGTHEESMRVRTRDVLVHALAAIGDICED